MGSVGGAVEERELRGNKLRFMDSVLYQRIIISMLNEI